jgi:hypothetical protein
MTPHSRPSTLIGTPTTERALQPRAMSAVGPEASAKSSIRADRPVSHTCEITFRPPSGVRVPTGKGTAVPGLVHAPTAVCVPSASYRVMIATSGESTRPTSAVTVANTSSGAVARATRVAIRRSAACSSAKPRSSTRVCALAIAVPTSWVKPASRPSVSAGSDSAPVDATVITPHIRPSMLIGAPTAERSPQPRPFTAGGPDASA